MKVGDVDSALVHAGARLRASMEEQIDVDGAFDRLRHSIRFRAIDPVLVPAAMSGPPGAGAREDAAIRMLYEAHAGPLLMFALRLTGGDRQRAEEVVQETLVRAWRDPHRRGSPSGLLRPWLMAVARRIVTGDAPRPDARATGPDAAAVVDVLRALHPSDREILIETYFRGRTVGQAAAELDLSPGAATSRTYHAMRALRAALEQRR